MQISNMKRFIYPGVEQAESGLAEALLRALKRLESCRSPMLPLTKDPLRKEKVKSDGLFTRLARFVENCENVGPRLCTL